MDRKEFLIELYQKYIKPIFYIGSVIYLMYFLKNALFDKNSIEHNLIFGVFTIALFLLLIILVATSIHIIFSKIPEKVKKVLDIILKVAIYVSIPFLIYLIYISWETKKYNIIIVIVALSIDKFIRRKKL
jgi:cobalamin biosynthesis protein CobD/CbiB